jgi:hypothetical protein
MRVPVLDAPVRPLFGRTPREILLLGCAAFGAVYPMVVPGIYFWQWSLTFAVAGVLIAVRFWPARGLAMGACVAALAQCACMHKVEDWPACTIVAALSVVLLASRDLAAKFEGSPSRIRWLPNAWASLPRADAARLRFSVYGMGVLAAVLCQGWCVKKFCANGVPPFDADSPWSMELVAFASLLIVLLVLGRAAPSPRRMLCDRFARGASSRALVVADTELLHQPLQHVTVRHS